MGDAKNLTGAAKVLASLELQFAGLHRAMKNYRPERDIILSPV